MKHVCIASLGFVNSKTIAEEYITGKSVKTLHCAKGPKCATKDTPKPVKDTKQLKDANLEVIVPMSIESLKRLRHPQMNWKRK